MIPILNLTRQYEALKPRLDQALIDVAASGHYIMGPQVEAFEQEMARYLGARHVIGCANGTDALFLALLALKIGPGDEVITTPFTFVATTEAIVQTGAKPVFVDVEPDTFNIDVSKIEAAITPNTKAILPVHLYGQPVDMDSLMAIANKRKLAVVEDCAQSIGAEFKGQKTGGIGSIGCFSFFPSKNLGCMGDGGMCATNDDELADRLRMLRMHGSRKRYYHDEAGVNSRLDAMQAAVLRVKLPHLDGWLDARREAAARYDNLLGPLADQLQPPAIADNRSHVFHQYTIKLNGDAALRDRVKAELEEAGIQSMIYYPVPLYKQKLHADLNANAADFPVCERLTDQVLSLPMFPEILPEEQEAVANALTRILSGKSLALQQ